MTTTTSGSPVLPAAVRPHPGAPAAVARTRVHQRRVGIKTRIAVVVGVVAIAGTAGAWYLLPAAIRPNSETYAVSKRDFSVVLHEKGELKAAKSIDVKCEVEGRSTIKWLIPEGTEVKEGEKLVELASNDIEDKIGIKAIEEAESKAAADAAAKEYDITVDEQASNVRKAELAVSNARIELNKYVKGDWEEQKTDADLEVKRSEEQLRRAQEKLQDSKELFEKNFITKMELDDDQFAVFEAEIAIQKAKLKKEILEAYTHDKDLTQKESDLAEADKELERARKSQEAKCKQAEARRDAAASKYQLTRQQLDKLTTQKSKTEIKAPAAGLVVYYSENSRWGNEGQIAEGKEVFERQTIINLPDISVMQVTVRIHEGKADKVKMDQQARVEIEGMPGVIYTGKVTKIAPLADSQNRWLNPDLKEYETEITLDGTHQTLKPGVTARAEIVVEEVRDVLVVPVQSVVSKQGKRFVFEGRGAEPSPITVELGRSNEQFVEVVNGLADGQRVRLAISEDDLKRLPEAPGQRREGPPVPELAKGETAAPKPPAPPKPEGRPTEVRGSDSGRGGESRGTRPSGGGGDRQSGRRGRPG